MGWVQNRYKTTLVDHMEVLEAIVGQQISDLELQRLGTAVGSQQDNSERLRKKNTAGREDRKRLASGARQGEEKRRKRLQSWSRCMVLAPRRLLAPPCLLLLLLLLLLLGLEHVGAALDNLHGPRQYVPPAEISSLTRQLLEAVLLGDYNLANVTRILTAGADPNAYDEQQMTALHWAVIQGQNETVKTLLARGAYTDALDASYRTPAHFVGIYGEKAGAEERSEGEVGDGEGGGEGREKEERAGGVGARTSRRRRGSGSRSARLRAGAGWGGPFPSILASLYFAGANLDAGDQAHNTPLHYAAMEGQTETATNLVLYGARLDVVNLWQRRTPYGMAVLVASPPPSSLLPPLLLSSS
eukprot:763202-Hanusia_phi.AAC.2